MPAKRLMGVKEVAEMTGLSTYTLYQMAREGRIPAVRIGRSIKFDVAAIDKWISNLPKASS